MVSFKLSFNTKTMQIFHITAPMEEWGFSGRHKDGSNVLGLVMFSIILGTTIGRMKEQGKLLQDFFAVLSEAMMIITSWVIW